MEHTDAQRELTAEKYLLGELPPGQREEFEEHMFECEECALDVRSGAAFAAQVRHEIRPRPAGEAWPSRASRSSSWFRIPAMILAAAAVASMAGVVIYQNSVSIPALRRTVADQQKLAILPAVLLLNGANRGGSVPSIDSPAGEPLLLFVDLPTEDRFSSYQLTAYPPSGAPVGPITVSQENARNTLNLRLPAGNLQPGAWTLVVEAREKTSSKPVELVQYRFDVRMTSPASR